MSDDHGGTRPWVGWTNDWTTRAWAASAALPDLRSALLSGRAFIASLKRFPGGLDLTVDGRCPAGSVSVSSLATRTVSGAATAVPRGSVLRVVQGPVDHAGPAVPASGTVIVATTPAAGDLTWNVPVDTSHDCFVRVEAADATGLVAASTQPAWLLRSVPSGGIPAPRAA